MTHFRKQDDLIFANAKTYALANCYEGTTPEGIQILAARYNQFDIQFEKSG